MDNQNQAPSTLNVVNKNNLAAELYALIAATYPANANDPCYLRDNKYVIGTLLCHLRQTCLDADLLQRNANMFRSFLQHFKYTNRCQWLSEIENALDYFFPT